MNPLPFVVVHAREKPMSPHNIRITVGRPVLGHLSSNSRTSLSHSHDFVPATVSVFHQEPGQFGLERQPGMEELKRPKLEQRTILINHMFDFQRKQQQTVWLNGHFLHFKVLIQMVLFFVDVVEGDIGATPDFPGEVVNPEDKAQFAVAKTHLQQISKMSFTFGPTLVHSCTHHSFFAEERRRLCKGFGRLHVNSAHQSALHASVKNRLKHQKHPTTNAVFRWVPVPVTHCCHGFNAQEQVP